MTGGRSETTMDVAATPEGIGAALTQVISLVATAERMSADYQLVNLNSLDRRVAAVCEAIATLSPEEARQFRPGMTALMAGLDRLEVATRQAYKALSSPGRGDDETSQLTELADTTRASAAYARALSVAPPPMSEPSRPGDERRRVDRRFKDRRKGQDRRQEDRRDGEASEAGG